MLNSANRIGNTKKKQEIKIKKSNETKSRKITKKEKNNVGETRPITSQKLSINKS